RPARHGTDGGPRLPHRRLRGAPGPPVGRARRDARALPRGTRHQPAQPPRRGRHRGPAPGDGALPRPLHRPAGRRTQRRQPPRARRDRRARPQRRRHDEHRRRRAPRDRTGRRPTQGAVMSYDLKHRPGTESIPGDGDREATDLTEAVRAEAEADRPEDAASTAERDTEPVGQPWAGAGSTPEASTVGLPGTTGDTTGGDERAIGRASVDTTGADEAWNDDVVDAYRLRWREIQIDFVDDPSVAVRRAEDLIEEVVQAGTSSLQATRPSSQARSRFSDQYENQPTCLDRA